MTKSLFENDNLPYLQLDEAKISCLNYFGYSISASKVTFINNNYLQSHVIYIKQIKEISLNELFELLSKKKGSK
jgi:hypothetical protein